MIVFTFILIFVECRNAGLSSIRPVQHRKKFKKERCRNQSGNRMLRYRTELPDARMPMHTYDRMKRIWCVETCVGNFSPAMGAKNQVGIGLSYRPASLCSLATQCRTRFLESIPRPIERLRFSTLSMKEVEDLWETGIPAREKRTGWASHHWRRGGRRSSLGHSSKGKKISFKYYTCI